MVHLAKVHSNEVCLVRVVRLAGNVKPFGVAALPNISADENPEYWSKIQGDELYDMKMLPESTVVGYILEGLPTRQQFVTVRS